MSVFSSYQTWVLLWFSFNVGWAEHATESKNKVLTKSQQSLPGSGKRSVGQDCLMSRVSFWGDENALEVDGGYGWKHYEYATYHWILHVKVWKWGILCYVSFTIRKKKSRPQMHCTRENDMRRLGTWWPHGCGREMEGELGVIETRLEAVGLLAQTWVLIFFDSSIFSFLSTTSASN